MPGFGSAGEYAFPQPSAEVSVTDCLCEWKGLMCRGTHLRELRSRTGERSVFRAR